jgi:hypothetical protein
MNNGILVEVCNFSIFKHPEKLKCVILSVFIHTHTRKRYSTSRLITGPGKVVNIGGWLWVKNRIVASRNEAKMASSVLWHTSVFFQEHYIRGQRRFTKVYNGL